MRCQTTTAMGLVLVVIFCMNAVNASDGRQNRLHRRPGEARELLDPAFETPNLRRIRRAVGSLSDAPAPSLRRSRRSVSGAPIATPRTSSLQGLHRRGFMRFVSSAAKSAKVAKAGSRGISTVRTASAASRVAHLGIKQTTTQALKTAAVPVKGVQAADALSQVLQGLEVSRMPKTAGTVAKASVDASAPESHASAGQATTANQASLPAAVPPTAVPPIAMPPAAVPLAPPPPSAGLSSLRGPAHAAGTALKLPVAMSAATPRSALQTPLQVVSTPNQRLGVSATAPAVTRDADPASQSTLTTLQQAPASTKGLAAPVLLPAFAAAAAAALPALADGVAPDPSPPMANAAAAGASSWAEGAALAVGSDASTQGLTLVPPLHVSPVAAGHLPAAPLHSPSLLAPPSDAAVAATSLVPAPPPSDLHLQAEAFASPAPPEPSIVKQPMMPASSSIALSTSPLSVAPAVAAAPMAPIGPVVPAAGPAAPIAASVAPTLLAVSNSAALEEPMAVNVAPF
ncbi:hypothetical protein CXG81DRAFT_17062 [Caulochytrium protostelioides]|uniref:Uncharacterized protein n=1 Tax=Caulochytrium protostelioides TaxID=1555241 RepID=A0A4P9WXN8_9FUNG|nr:hypothetical protein CAUPRSCDRAFT_10207 [Caulochytrium protostelioides]RKP03441.1 hypothetical protein CXG81DRAFT_17062 [Caulochytrium protostelioides]|eukprot:RKP03441.1 hypothetical protein CXG81DRAFT_17062 [Caulochytrium protostelioides]